MMKTNIEDLSTIKKKINFEIPADEVKEVMDKVFVKVSQEARIKGFRKGKAPKNVIEQQYGENIKLEAADELINNSYKKAVIENSLKPISMPAVSNVQFQDNGLFVFEATVEVAPEIELKKYTGFELDGANVEASEKDLEDYIKSVRDYHAEMTPVEEERAVQNDDFVDINFEGFVDDIAFEGGKAEHYMLGIGTKSFIEGFEEQIIGMNIDEEKNVNVTFPKEYPKAEIAGKPAMFKVKLNSIKKRELPAIDDEFAKKLNLDNLENMNKTYMKEIVKYKKETLENILREQIAEKLLAENPVEVPESQILDSLKNIKQELRTNIEQQQKRQLTEKELREHNEKWDTEHKKSAEDRVRFSYIVMQIAEKEGLKIEEADYDSEYQKLADQYNVDLPKIQELYEKSPQMKDDLLSRMMMSKVMTYVTENYKITIKESEEDKEDKKDQKNQKKKSKK